ncbi:MAG: TonB-dependent receptor, partial [Candidatus Omnitrophica bacterium]|nr:TonB-dependent receptor [Candidatus Omnitrophota bacterium]
NLDIPFTSFDVQRIDIEKEGVSSKYGAGAFSGSANFIIKKPVKRKLILNTEFGENALFGQGVSFSQPYKDFLTRISFENKVAKAARPNTDFQYKTASAYLERDFGDALFDSLFGYQKKDFGADSFYSNLFPEEEEHTETIFTKTGVENKLDLGTLKNSVYFRRHRDKFILKRNSPTPVNYHTTYVYGLNSQINIPFSLGDLLLGLDAGKDQINSTNLGSHERLFEAGSTGFVLKPIKGWDAECRFRVDNYQKWGSQESYNLGLGYDVIPESLKLKSSFSRAFRIPSFTELYYSDAANRGNAELKEETSDNFRVGFDYKNEKIAFGLEGFLRRGRDLIDWTRYSENDVWQATNLGSVDFKGIEFSAKFKPYLNLTYTYMEADKGQSGFLSKYALDILKHQLLIGLNQKVLGLNFNWQFSYNQRYYGDTYFVGNLYLGKKIAKRDFTLEPFVRIDNFSNAKYTEVGGVLTPGRWIKSGLRLEW